jgi:LemA protein
MNAVKVLLFVLLAFGVAVLIVGGCVYGGYNKAVRLDETTHGAYAEIENQMQRRFDLIDNLVETVKGYAKQEKDVFLGVAEARKAYFQARDHKSPAEMAKANNSFSSALSRLLVLRETYPELKSNESFLKLQDEIAGTENRLAVARKRYNDAVKELNVFTRKLTGRFYSSLAGVKPAEYFKVPETAKAVPKVDFSTPSETGSPAPASAPSN